MILNTRGILLDLGSHGGYLTNYMAKQAKASEVIAIDISPEAISFIKKQHPDWRAICADIEGKIDIADRSVDLITSLDVFEHLFKPERVIKEAGRIIKPGGFFLVAVPHETILWKIIWYLWTKFGPGKVWQEVHLQNFKKKSLDKLFSYHGFVKESEAIIHFGMYYITKYKYG